MSLDLQLHRLTTLFTPAASSCASANAQSDNSFHTTCACETPSCADRLLLSAYTNLTAILEPAI
eukprot:1457773-Amphidinium_carterae.2